MSYFKSVILKKPDNIGSYLSLALAEKDSNDSDSISLDVLDCMLNDRDYVEWLSSYINKGLLHFSNFRTKESFLTEEILDVEMHLSVAKEALKSQDLKTAESALHSSLENIPTLLNALSDLTCDLYSVKWRHNEARDDLTNAEKVFVQALVRDTQSPDVLASLGKICLDAERYEDAADYFKLIILKRPNDIGAYIGLALAAKQLNDEQTFTIAHERLCALDPSKSELGGFKQIDKSAAIEVT